MKELLNNIDKAIEQELHMANEQNPLFRSTHEGLGVILEEVEEALTEQEKLCRHFNSFKASVFDDSFLEKDADFSTLGLMATDAKHLAAEAVQVAAMCQKFVESFCKVQVMIGRCIKGVKPCAWRVPKGMEIKVGDMCKVIMQHGSSYARAERIEEWTQSEAEDVKAFVEEVIE